MKKSLVISGWPGIGKSSVSNRSNGFLVADSDSSKFDKAFFPDNYIQHIKDKRADNTTDVIMVSSHKAVRDALLANDIEFTLVYPFRTDKAEYLQKYKDRGSPEEFVQLLDEKWDDWYTEVMNMQGCQHHVLQRGEYLSDAMPILKNNWYLEKRGNMLRKFVKSSGMPRKDIHKKVARDVYRYIIRACTYAAKDGHQFFQGTLQIIHNSSERMRPTDLVRDLQETLRNEALKAEITKEVHSLGNIPFGSAPFHHYAEWMGGGPKRNIRNLQYTQVSGEPAGSVVIKLHIYVEW